MDSTQLYKKVLAAMSIVFFILLQFTSCATIKTSDTSASDILTDIEKATVPTGSPQLSETSTPTSTPSATQMESGAILMLEPPQSKISIGVSPTVLGIRKRYYVPDEDTQLKISEMMKDVDAGSMKQMEVCEPVGISVIYDGLEWELACDGSLYSHDKGPKMRITGYTVLCEYLISLAGEACGISRLDPGSIRDIVRAELSYSRHGDVETANQVIIDPEKLKHLEERLKDAYIMLGGTGCPFEMALLTLERKDGEIIQLRLAADSCQVYFHDGVFYDYDSTPNQTNSSDSNETNEDVLNLFDEIPWIGKTLK